MLPYGFEEEIWAAAIAVRSRDEAEASRLGVSVDKLHARRERVERVDAHETERLALIERLGADRRRIDPEDYRLIVNPDDTALSARFDGLDGKHAWTETLAWWAGSKVEGRIARPAFLVLSGERGCGKTVAALALKARKGGVVVNATEMARAWKNEHDEAQDLRERILGTELLIVDDLGTEKDRAAGFVALQVLVDERQGVGYRTILTTNLPWSLDPRKRLEEMKRKGATDVALSAEQQRLEAIETITNRYDSRTTDRLIHNGRFVAIKDKDMRRKVGA